MKYKLILFDADGTLFDFEKAEKRAFFETMRNFGIKEDLVLLHTEYERINKAVWKEFEENRISAAELRIIRFLRFFERCNLSHDARKMSDHYLKNLSAGTDLLPEAASIVKYFSQRIRVAIVTNGLADVQRPRFSRSILSPFFPHIFISEEIGAAKPQRRFFDAVFAKLPYSDSTLIVGDNLSSDIKGGNDYGIDTCWFNRLNVKNETSIKPHYEINNLSELKNILLS